MYKHAGCGGLLTRSSDGKYKCRLCKSKVEVGKPKEADFREIDRKEDEWQKRLLREEAEFYTEIPGRTPRGVRLIR